jgi:hypothetical protein
MAISARERSATAALRDGATVEVEGVLFVIAGDGRVRDKGDWYVAQRNGGPKLLTARSFSFYKQGADGETVTRENLSDDEFPSWINPVEPAYAFDYPECVKVAIAE